MPGDCLSRNDAVEDEIDDRSVLVFPGGTGVPPVLSGRDGRDARAPCATRRLAHQMVMPEDQRAFFCYRPSIAVAIASFRFPSNSKCYAVDVDKARLAGTLALHRSGVLEGGRPRPPLDCSTACFPQLLPNHTRRARVQGLPINSRVMRLTFVRWGGTSGPAEHPPSG